MDIPTKPKEQLFEKLKAKGLFWSYSPGICYDESKDDLLMETTLKYAELDDIKVLFISFFVSLYFMSMILKMILSPTYNPKS